MIFCHDVHKIVRDSFLTSIAMIDPVITQAYRFIEFSIPEVFMNN